MKGFDDLCEFFDQLGRATDRVIGWVVVVAVVGGLVTAGAIAWRLANR